VVSSDTEPNLLFSVTCFTGAPQQNQAAVRNLCCDDCGHDWQGRGRRIGGAELLATKQDIAGDRPRDSCEKASVFRQQRDADPAFAAESEDERATGDLPVADEALNRVNGQAQADLIAILTDTVSPSR
jgi:hypothetical protein